ncbi:MAG: AtpZ/AtpI family protein [Planctomycetota bacterium]
MARGVSIILGPSTSFFAEGMAARPQQSSDSARSLGAGLTFAVTVALFALGGHWLDGRTGTSPLFVLLGVLLGIVGGTIHLLRVLSPATLPFGRPAAKRDSSPESDSTPGPRPDDPSPR